MQEIYARAISAGPQATAGAITCYGPDCFQRTHQIIAVLMLVSACCLIRVAWSKRGLYRQIWQHEAQSAAIAAAPPPISRCFFDGGGRDDGSSSSKSNTDACLRCRPRALTLR